MKLQIIFVVIFGAITCVVSQDEMTTMASAVTENSPEAMTTQMEAIAMTQMESVATTTPPATMQNVQQDMTASMSTVESAKVENPMVEVSTQGAVMSDSPITTQAAAEATIPATREATTEAIMPSTHAQTEEATTVKMPPMARSPTTLAPETTTNASNYLKFNLSSFLSAAFFILLTF